MVKKIENYTKPQIPPKSEFLTAKNIVTIISTGLLTITLGCSGNAKLVDSTETTKQIAPPAKELNESIKTNYPNPFMPVTSININIDQNKAPQHVKIDIFNVKGQLIRVLVDADFEAGKHDIIWDGLDDEGNKAESGIYFYKSSIDGIEIGTKKIISMK